MAWLLPLQTSQSSLQRYRHIRGQLDALNAQEPVSDRDKFSSRISFEHVVQGLFDDLGGLKDDGPFNAAWMTFCREDLVAEKRIAEDQLFDAYEKGREDAIKSMMAGRVIPQPLTIPAPNGFNPTRPSAGIVLTEQGNGRDTATPVDDVEDAGETALAGERASPLGKPEASGLPFARARHRHQIARPLRKIPRRATREAR